MRIQRIQAEPRQLTLQNPSLIHNEQVCSYYIVLIKNFSLMERLIYILSRTHTYSFHCYRSGTRCVHLTKHSLKGPNFKLKYKAYLHNKMFIIIFLDENLDSQLSFGQFSLKSEAITFWGVLVGLWFL